MLQPKRFFLCADDFGQSEAISLGIVDLLQSRRLSATSVMTRSPRWPGDAALLRDLGPDCAIGLHLDLTHPTHQPMGGLGRLLVLSHLRLLSRRDLEHTFHEQTDRFTQAMGRLPDFLDGHQHVHAWPQIREAFASLIERHWPCTQAPRQAPWVRATDRLVGQTDTPVKGWVVRFSSRGFSQRMAGLGVPVSRAFGGLYALSGRPVRPLLESWLQDLPDGTWLMMHPGRPSLSDQSDPIAAARAVEYEHLRSDTFLSDLDRAGASVFRGSLDLLPKG
jgi:chitin disaccharide deacetylase